MTRKEIIKLLEMMTASYPNTKIPNPSDLVSAWELAFGDDPADVIYKAARHHMNTCKFFPTVADIRQSINKGQLIYGNQPQHSAPVIEAPKAPAVKIDPTISFCDLCGLCDQKIQELCEF